jgi:hypothetical protein
MKWLSGVWTDFDPLKILSSFVYCGKGEHEIVDDKIKIDFNRLHSVLRQILVKQKILKNVVDDEIELDEATEIMDEHDNQFAKG